MTIFCMQYYCYIIARCDCVHVVCMLYYCKVWLFAVLSSIVYLVAKFLIFLDGVGVQPCSVVGAVSLWRL